jgi:hypothetical protein
VPSVPTERQHSLAKEVADKTVLSRLKSDPNGTSRAAPTRAPNISLQSTKFPI